MINVGVLALNTVGTTVSTSHTTVSMYPRGVPAAVCSVLTVCGEFQINMACSHSQRLLSQEAATTLTG